MDAVGFSQAVLIKSDSETETDEEMYGDHLAKRARHMPARPSSAANVEGLLEVPMNKHLVTIATLDTPSLQPLMSYRCLKGTFLEAEDLTSANWMDMYCQRL